MGKSVDKIISSDILEKDEVKRLDESVIKKEVENLENLLKPTDPKNHSEMMDFKRFKINQKNQKSERNLRKKNALYALRFSASWASFIVILILLHGFGGNYNFFKLTEAEFLFVIGSLTASIFAFYTLVLKYLFYKKEE